MIGLRRPSQSSSAARVGLRLVAEATGRPLTSRVEVGVKALSRKGAVLWLPSPFIDGCHVLMDVHNITPKLLEVFIPGENPETHPDLVLLGRIVSYRQDESCQPPRFVVEVAWVERPDAGGDQGRALKRLIRLIKQGGALALGGLW